jgi:hypothetical protein
MEEEIILNIILLPIYIVLYVARNDVRHAGVQYIIDSAVIALDENPDRRFIYVEMAFFWRWWNQQTEEIRDKVRQFVNEGIIDSVYYLSSNNNIIFKRST